MDLLKTNDGEIKKKMKKKTTKMMRIERYMCVARRTRAAPGTPQKGQVVVGRCSATLLCRLLVREYLWLAARTT
jgi:hypothetical protein